VYGDGTNVRDWIFVDDHVQALLLAMERGVVGRTYTLGGNAQRANIDVVRTICRIVDELRPSLPHGPSEGLIEFVKDRPGHDQRYAVDGQLAARELGFAPKTRFEDGIRATVAWYAGQSRWIDRVRSGTYRERLGLGGP
jgi:dTDP-glucose 4,6-dehydratase